MALRRSGVELENVEVSHFVLRTTGGKRKFSRPIIIVGNHSIMVSRLPFAAICRRAPSPAAMSESFSMATARRSAASAAGLRFLPRGMAHAGSSSGSSSRALYFAALDVSEPLAGAQSPSITGMGHKGGSITNKPKEMTIKYNCLEVRRCRRCLPHGECARPTASLTALLASCCCSRAGAPS